MDRCQRKPGCENLADRDGCEETGSERKAKGKKPHAWVERDASEWPGDGEAAGAGLQPGQRKGRGEPDWLL